MSVVRVAAVRSKMNQDLIAPKQKFTYIADFETAMKSCNEVAKGATVIAIDTEHYNFSYRQLGSNRLPYPVKCWNSCGPFVAILQLSTNDQTFVFDILAMGFLPNQLRCLLEQDNVVKVVFDNNAESSALNNTFGLKMRNVLDLQRVTERLASGCLIPGIRMSAMPASASLANTARAYLGVELDKSYQRFDWTKSNIPFHALRYAAEDSMILLRLVQFLAALYSVVWSGRRLSETSVEEVVKLLVREHGSKTPLSVATKDLPNEELSTKRLFKVKRLRSTQCFE